jgi:hypothetical protein
MHNYFIVDNIDVAAVRKEAQSRAFDKRNPEDSIVHFHPYNPEGCPDNCEFEEYKVGRGQTWPKEEARK